MESLEELFERLKLKDSQPPNSSPNKATNSDANLNRFSQTSDLIIIDFKLARDSRSYDPEYQMYPPNTINYPPGSLLCTSIPASDPSGITKCLISSELKSQILMIPGFPRAPLPSPESIYHVHIPQPFTVGLGISANRQIHVGELIISERPIMLFPADIRYNGGLSLATLRESLIDFVASRMRDEDISAMYWLENVHKEYAGSLLHGIFDTNSKIVMFGSETYLGIAKEVSRVNHSCLPNAILRFDYPSFSFVLHAVREIEEGEQIAISYVNSPTDPQTLAQCHSYLQQKYKIPQCTNDCCHPHSLQTRFDILNKATVLQNIFENHIQGNVKADLRLIHHEARVLALLMRNMKMEACEAMITVVAIGCSLMQLLYPDSLDMDENACFMKWAETLAMAHEGENGVRYLEIVRRNRAAGIM